MSESFILVCQKSQIQIHMYFCIRDPLDETCMSHVIRGGDVCVKMLVRIHSCLRIDEIGPADCSVVGWAHDMIQVPALPEVQTLSRRNYGTFKLEKPLNFGCFPLTTCQERGFENEPVKMTN